MADGLTLRGTWWLPSRTREQGVPGVLSLSPDSFRLDIDGTLHDVESGLHPLIALERDVPDVIDRILGDTAEHRLVTLEDCQFAGQGSHGRQDTTVLSEVYWPSIACIGAWFEEGEALAFDHVGVWFTSLHAWTATSGFTRRSRMWPHPGRKFHAEHKPVADRTATFPDGTTMKLTFPLRKDAEGLFTSSITLTQDTHFAFEYPQPRSIKGVQEHVFTLRNFLTLGVGEAVNVTKLIGYRKPHPDESPSIGREVEIHYQHQEKESPREAKHHHFMVFLLQDIDDAFEDHLLRWFRCTSELRRVIDLYFATRHVDFMHLETRFMSYAQAIEGYHRRRLSKSLYDEDAFERYREEIVGPLRGRGSVYQIAKRALRFANEPALRERITDVLKLLPEPGASIVDSGVTTPQHRFAERMAAIRNDYAHDLGSEPSHSELVVAMLQAKAIVEALFLHEVGFSSALIDEKLGRARTYSLIRQMSERHTAMILPPEDRPMTTA